MKCFILSLFVLGCGCAALAQTTPIIGQPTQMVGGAASAESTTTPSNLRYLADPALLKRCEQRLAAFNSKPCDIIFIGDSITEGWLGAGKAIWDEDYAPRNALDFGVSGDKTQNVLWRLANMDVQNLKPKVAVVMIGTNNVDDSPHAIADGVKEILTNVQATFSGVKIILVSITPNARAYDKMNQVNALIKNNADDSSTYYLDLVPLMPAVTTNNPDGTSDTNWKGIGKDHLHPDAEGYKIWADAMDPLLKKLMSGQ